MLGSLFNLMGLLGIYMLIGVVCRKLNILTPEAKDGLVSFLIDVVLPCNIVKSFLGGFDDDIWNVFLTLFFVSCAVQVMTLFVGQALYGRMEPDTAACFKYATVTSNAGFLGNPMAHLVFGDTGLLYASVFLIPQRVVMWSIGVAFFTGGISVKDILKKTVTHPCIVAVFIGIPLMVLRIPLPGLLVEVLESISACCTPMSMIVMGTLILDLDWRTMLEKSQIFFAMLRLAILPGIVWGICRMFAVDPLVSGVSVILTAMPAGSMTPIFANKYHKDEASATACFVLTTVLSVITIPVWSVILK